MKDLFALLSEIGLRLGVKLENYEKLLNKFDYKILQTLNKIYVINIWKYFTSTHKDVFDKQSIDLL